MSDDKLQTDIHRGNRARQLLDDPLFSETFSALEKEYIEFWKQGTKAHDADARERIWHAVQVVGKVRQHLSVIADNGKLAQADLNQLIDKKPKRFGLV